MKKGGVGRRGGGRQREEEEGARKRGTRMRKGKEDLGSGERMGYGLNQTSMQIYHLFVLNIWACACSYLVLVHSEYTGSYYDIVATQLVWRRSWTPRTLREIT